MTATTYDYPTAFSCWGAEERAAIARVLASGRHTMGSEVAALEREFADWHGMRHGIMVNSGSSANLVAVAALQYLGLERGAVAVVPAIAWSTTYAPLVQHGLELVLADVDATWCASINGLPAMPVKASLVVGCPVLGTSAWSINWAAFALASGAAYVEDCCESLGAVDLAGNRAGTLGLMNTFSFFHSHQISAIEGGMILTDDDESADACRMLRAHGWTRDRTKPPGHVPAFDEEYDFRLFGFNVRPVEMHAAIARAQLQKLPGFIDARRANAAHFRGLTIDLPIEHPVAIGKPSPFGLQFTVADRETRARLAGALRGASIDCRLPTGGSFRLHHYGAPWRDQATPVADHVHERGMFLGNAPFDISNKIERAVAVMREVLQ